MTIFDWYTTGIWHDGICIMYNDFFAVIFWYRFYILKMNLVQLVKVQFLL